MTSDFDATSPPLPGFLLSLPETLLRGCRYLPFGSQIPLPGGVITVQSMASDGEELFVELARSREPFVMTLEAFDEEEPEEGARRSPDRGVVGIIATHTLDEDLGVTTTEILGVGRVVIDQLYLIEQDDSPSPRADVTPLPATTQGEALQTIQDALELLVEGFVEPLQHANEDFVRVLGHFACAHHDPSLNIDRVANILAERQPALLREFMTQPSMLTRLALLQQEMRRVHARLLAHINN